MSRRKLVDDEMDAQSESRTDDEGTPDIGRRAKQPRGTPSPPRTQRSLSETPVAPMVPLDPRFPHLLVSSTPTKRRKHKAAEDDSSSNAAATHTGEDDTLSNSGETASEDGAASLHKDIFSFGDYDQSTVCPWTDLEYKTLTAHTLAMQLLGDSGLAIAMTSPLLDRTASPGDHDSLSARAQSWAASSKPPKQVAKAHKRVQILMNDDEAPPKNAQTPINPLKVSHLTVDHLIYLITHTQISQDKFFLDTLILTHDYFMKSHELLATLIVVYRASQLASSAIRDQSCTTSEDLSQSLGSPRAGSAAAVIEVDDSQITGLTVAPSDLAASGHRELRASTTESSSDDSSHGSKSPRSASAVAPLEPRASSGGVTLSGLNSLSSSTASLKGPATPPVGHRPSTPAGDVSNSSSSAHPSSPYRASNSFRSKDRSLSDILTDNSSVSAPNLLSASSNSVSNALPSASSSQNEDMGRTLQRMRLINILKKLLELRFYTLRRSRSFGKLLQKFVLELLLSNDESEVRFGDLLKTTMKTNAKGVREGAEDKDAPAPAPILTAASPNTTTLRFKSTSARKTLDDYSTVELARQITLIDFQNWNAIPLSEFFHAHFNGKDSAAKCPRITACTARFNDLAGWVSSTVVLAAKKKHRIAVMQKFIQVAEELRRLQNFHGLMAFYSALNQGAILRLKKTWKGLPSKVLTMWNGINKFLDSSDNFKSYREFIRVVDPPCIPYIGFILGGLTFAEEFPSFVEVQPEKEKESSGERSKSLTKVRSSSRTGLVRDSSDSGGETLGKDSPSGSRRSPDRGEPAQVSSVRLTSSQSRRRSSSRSKPRSTPAPTSNDSITDSEPTGEEPTIVTHRVEDVTASDVSDVSVSSPRPSRTRNSTPSSHTSTSTGHSSDSDASEDSRRGRKAPLEATPTEDTKISAGKRSIGGSSPPRTLASSLSSITVSTATLPVSPTASRSKKSLKASQHTVKDILPAGQQYVNWRKMIMLSKAFADIIRLQRTRYDLVVVKEIERFVSDLRSHSWFLNSDELSATSLQIEAEPSDGGSPSISRHETASPSKEVSDSKKKDKKDKKDKKKAIPVFADLAHDQTLFNEFRKFLIAQLSHENLVFWESVNKFKQVDMATPAKVKVAANEIFNRFITGTLDDGAYTIGLSLDIKDSITKRIGTNDLDANMFDLALQEVEHSTLKSSFQTFLNDTYSHK